METIFASIVSLAVGGFFLYLTYRYIGEFSRAVLGVLYGLAALAYVLLMVGLFVKAAAETMTSITGESRRMSHAAVGFWLAFFASLLLFRWISDLTSGGVSNTSDLSKLPPLVRPKELPPHDDAGWQEIKPPSAPRPARGREWES